jgi:MATE family multidrug resistance protein
VSSEQRLPARRIDAAGRAHVDYRAIWLLAGPLIANSAIQAILNLTDTWFVGRLSASAIAAMGAIFWILLCLIFLLGGVGMAVQTFAAQANGGGRRRRASQAAWSGVYASLLATPLFVAAGFLGAPLLALLHLDAEVQRLALAYWWPRLAAGGPLALLAWSLTGFFNGIGRSRITLLVTVVMALMNVPFNQWFMFGLGMGIAGSAWGTVAAQLVGLAVALAVFLGARTRHSFGSHLTWRRTAVLRQFSLGLPMGLSAVADLLGIALFQLMLLTLGTTEGAATQVVLMLTSLAYMPGVGLSLAGTTLVGHAIGAGDHDWAATLGNGIIRLVVLFMGTVGVLLALAGPWLMPLFVSAADPSGPALAALGVTLLWIAAAYQAFDGLHLGASFCLRGAGDVRVPAAFIAILSWGLWMPLTHALTFPPGAGWVHFLPQFGYGAAGGWAALVAYVMVLGVGLWLRWRSGAWRRLQLAPG